VTLCPNGSAPNPTAQPYAWITWVESQRFLGTLFSKFSWLAFLLEPVLVTTATFCATEPAQPVYPGDATVSAASHDPAAFETVIQYLKDTATWNLWSRICQCNAAPVPGCNAQLDSQASNLPSHTTTTTEWDRLEFHVTTNGYTVWALDIDVYQVGPTTIELWDGPAATRDIYSWTPPGTGWQRFVLPTPRSMPSGGQFFALMNLINGGFQPYYVNPNGLPTTVGFVAYDGWQYASSDTGVWTPWPARMGLDPVICTGSPAAYTPAPPPPPATTLPDVPTSSCTTVADLCALLNPMIDQIALLKQRLDLLQRRLLPFAWIPGPTFAGLTGTGVLSVTDCLGCIVQLTTVPASWGSTAETPRRLIPAVGSIQGRNGANYDNRRDLHYEHELIVTEAPWADGIRYNFRGGVVASITPIYPEP